MQGPTPAKIRKIATAAGLIGFPLFGVLSSVFDADEGTGMAGSDLYRIAAAHHTGIWISGLLFVVSAILTIPALGVLHLIRKRGTVLGFLGGAFMLVGAFGHMGYGTWQLMLAKIPADADQAALVSYLDRSNAVGNLLLPLLFAIVIGAILLTFGLYRAGVAGLWVPLTIVGCAIAETALDSVNSKWVYVVIWAVMGVALGAIGLRVLVASDGEWERGELGSATPEATAERRGVSAAAVR